MVLKKLLGAFKDKDIQYALMGGFALGLWGVHRATIDIDFLVDRNDLKQIDGIMTKLNYECIHQTINVSQYVSPLSVFGEIDFLHAFREVSLSMLRRAEERKIFDGRLTVKVLKPEDLIGLKIQAMINDRSRWMRELSDIEGIIKLNQKNLDWSLLEEYFSLFNMKEKVKELKEKYSDSE